MLMLALVQFAEAIYFQQQKAIWPTLFCAAFQKVAKTRSAAASNTNYTT